MSLPDLPCDALSKPERVVYSVGGGRWRFRRASRRDADLRGAGRPHAADPAHGVRDAGGHGLVIEPCNAVEGGNQTLDRLKGCLAQMKRQAAGAGLCLARLFRVGTKNVPTLR